ncbi:14963_t:CDS:2 [Funneliformis geosporum]|nr:14963_t:CDS:2 [Funneliformis geosporum]
MLKFRTQGYNGYSLQFSPFIENKIACAASANFGLVGNGRLFILNTGIGPEGVEVERIYDTQDGLFDCSWSEINENQVVTASGDGSIKLWDIKLAEFPIQNWHEHSREVFSVEWNLIKKDTFVSGSWDHSIKLWAPERPQSLITFNIEHTNCIYNTIWSPNNPDLFGSASGDNTVKIWDTKLPHSIQTIQAHPNFETLSMDWNKYQENVIVTASSDKSIKLWDLRRPDRELLCLQGHEYAVRRVKCSPHNGNIIASVSYDMTMRIWDISRQNNPLVNVYDGHSEFVVGVDYNLYIEGQIATCAWDENVHIFQPQGLLVFPHLCTTKRKTEKLLHFVNCSTEYSSTPCMEFNWLLEALSLADDQR